jgi:hypothetical protein
MLVLELLGIEDPTVTERSFASHYMKNQGFLISHLSALRDAVGVNHPLYVALTQEKFEDFKHGIRDYETFDKRVSFLCGMHPRLGQSSRLAMLDDDTARFIIACAFYH